MPRPAALLLACCALACGGDPGAAPPADGPDVVLVLLDTLRPDHLELYGAERATAPWLTTLGEGGAVFERAFSTSGWTPPSTASAITGLYPERHGVIHGLDTDKQTARAVAAGEAATLDVPALPGSHPTLAERFRAAGYATFGVATNVHVNALVGHDRGFDRFELHADADAEAVRARLDAWSDELLGDRPTFLYLHLNDVHRPYHQRLPWYEPKDETLADLAAAYDSEIAYVDQVLARMHARFGWEDDTLVCVISDHGEGFGERFGGERLPPEGFVGHGPSLSWVVNRCVLLLAGPGVPATRVTANVSLVDVVPTLLDLAGLEPADEVDGLSLRPLLGGGVPGPFAERALFAQRKHRRPVTDRFLWAVIQGRWKLIHDEADGSRRLYDTRADPTEQRDVASMAPDMVARLAGLRERHAARGLVSGAAEDGVQVELTDELLETLRELGYAGDDDRH